jgi:protein ImuB
MTIRTLAVCCDQWPVVATGRSAERPLAVVRGNKVVAANALARLEGVKGALRRREAHSRCPTLELVEQDRARDAREFEAVMGGLESIAPRWEVSEPGRCAVEVRGPSRFHGGDMPTALRVRREVVGILEETGAGACEGVGVAVADGPWAAALVARQAARQAQMPNGSSLGEPGCIVVPPGATAAHLARMPVGWITEGGVGWARQGELEDLVGVLVRLGLRDFARLAALEPTDVLGRFGPVGRACHDLARGAERDALVLADLPPELGVSIDLDPPVLRVEQAAFHSKALADELHAGLSARGLACIRVLVSAETELGERIERRWRHEGSLSAVAIAQRLRWQLEGWLSNGRGVSRCQGAISRLELIPEQVVADNGRQLGFWGGTSDAARRLARSVARVQGVLGVESVVVPLVEGARAPGERHRMVPFEGFEHDDPPTDPIPSGAGRPWPGSLPSPSPAVIWPTPLPAEVLDEHGRRVRVSGRGVLGSVPVRCSLDGGPWLAVTSWAGPWCTEERWWDPLTHRRRARLQVVLGGGDDCTAHLLCLESGSWWVEGDYD